MRPIYAAVLGAAIALPLGVAGLTSPAHAEPYYGYGYGNSYNPQQFRHEEWEHRQAERAHDRWLATHPYAQNDWRWRHEHEHEHDWRDHVPPVYR